MRPKNQRYKLEPEQIEAVQTEIRRLRDGDYSGTKILAIKFIRAMFGKVGEENLMDLADAKYCVEHVCDYDKIMQE